jgi:Tol biopolymer transport system component
MRFKLADLNDIAPDASALLVKSWDEKSHDDLKRWIQPLPGGEPRGLNLDYDTARFVPGGRIVFTYSGGSVYVANPDGSSRRKLATAPGFAFGPAVSPDGNRVRFTVQGDNLLHSIWEVNSDGTGLHEVEMRGLPETIGEISGSWSHDGRYFLFQVEHGGRWDLWALPERSGLLRRSIAPLQLTNGPLSYESPVWSREGNQVFAVGSKKRGELIRYDTKSRDFVPYLSGISAVESRVSGDGKHIIYVSYPDRTLWRSRSDGSERMQLTFPPIMVFYPEISPDGSKVAFSGMDPHSGMGVYVLSIEGGTPERVAEFGHAPAWSPDGNSLAFAAIVPGRHVFDENHWCEIRILDLRTRKVSVIPGLEDSLGTL